MGRRGGRTARSNSQRGVEPAAHWTSRWRSTRCRRWDVAKSRAGREKRPLVSMTRTSPPWIWRPVPLRTWRSGGADGGTGPARLAVLALDHPAPPERVGGLDVGAVVTASADLPGVRAAVAAHQITNGVLELGAVEAVEVLDRRPQALCANSFPTRGFLPPVQPERTGGRRDPQPQKDDPGVRGQPRHQRHDQAHGHQRHACEEPGVDLALGPATAPGRAAAHRPLSAVGKTMGYETVGAGRTAGFSHPGHLIG